MTPIGKGARFLVLEGLYRGREGVVASPVRTRGGWWKVDIGEGEIIEVSPNDIEAGHLKRLDDAPAEVDPLFAELAALEAERAATRPHGEATDDATSADTWISIANMELDAADMQTADGGSDAGYRAAMMKVALYALAAVRCMDRDNSR